MFPLLTTERFFLQQIFPEDQQFIFEGLSHPDIIRFYGVRYDSLEATKKQMDWYEKNLKENTGCSWKIVDKTSGEKIGVVAYYYFKPEHKKAEIGFWIFPQYWNKGIVTETLKAVIAYCRKEKGIHRLEAFVEEGNEASSRVLEKLGFVCEGKMYECEIKDGRFINLIIFGLLSDRQRELE
ncbi:MAG TPA: GNAT family N-acetyltransferase [Chitinophagaceae bacterium]|jgi:ribosomal-protein-alanine N-acetyltransferase|nr:GNAT family N-acetyltransferase [Chitinophagaceae bacterium]